MQATLHPTRPALTFLADGEVEAATLTYADLDARACALAARLLADVPRGTRACLFYPPGVDYVVALFACLYAGLIAVPGYPPRSRRRLRRLEALIEEPQHVVALTNASTWSLIAGTLETAPAAFRDLRWIVTDDGVTDDGAVAAADAPLPEIDPGAVAIIQYTSGSTATPRGVMLTHRNLLHNMGQIRQRFDVTPETRVVTWLPPYHDMGLIGVLLTGLGSGAWLIQMSPAAFTQRPARWLEAISKYRATISGAPNSAYEFCVQRVSAEDRARLDLGSWKVAFNGAEAVRPATLDRFETAFGPCGFRRSAWLPCYGLAEATLMVTARPPDAGPTTTAFESDLLRRHIAAPTPAGAPATPLAGCGTVIDDTCLRIVDPETLAACAPDCVGEIWVTGPSVAQGYWHRPDETAATFAARLQDDDRVYLRTGDLGCVRDGELFVTGRLKDLVIVNGANHNPHEIEASAQASHLALRPGSGAAFAIDAAGGERLVIVHEVEPRASYTADDVFAAVRRAVAETHGIDTSAIVLIAAGTIPRTSSGKIRRRDCRAAFLDGTLEAVARWDARSDADVREWLVANVASRLALPPDQVKTTEAFVEFGLDSADAVALVLELEAWLKKPVSPTVIWDYPTIDLLARHLSGASSPLPVVADVPAGDDSIAIVGIGCRFPGAADPAAFWRLLREGRSGISEVPSGRWDLSPWRPGGQETAETNAARWGGFLTDVDRFDPYFFGIVPREAAAMDPQQRLLMEVAWEALEDAGIPASSLAGSRTGVFVGISSADYARRHGAELDIYTGTGNALSIASNRLSYFLDLKGPSLAVDTACSSSLTAVHLACQSILRGEATMALAGGVNLLLSPEPSLVFAQARMLAPDGICRVFDAEANGYVRGEGAGVVVLKRLADARRDGDRIAAVILSTSVNQDGRTNGLTAPNGPSQRAVLQEALRAARVRPDEVGYVEAHGTGTPLGDPIEVQSLTAVLGAGAGDAPACWVGSLKANVGHLEPAAGIASLIKTVLALGHEEIPPQINVRALNPHLRLDTTRVGIPVAAQPWRRGTRRRIATVNAFGFGGTNACAVVAEAPAREEVPTAAGPQLFTLSARTEPALRRLAAEYAAALDGSGATLAEFCYSANTGRDAFPARWAWIATSASDLRDALASLAGGQSPALATRGTPDLEAARDRFVHGDAIDWTAFYAGRRHARVALPTYPFERERFWMREVATPLAVATSDGNDEQEQTRPLLGRRLPTAAPVFEDTLPADSLAYLQEHAVNGQAVLPGAAYVEMALEAALEELGGGALELSDIAFLRAMFLTPDVRRTTQIALSSSTTAGAGRTTTFTIFSRPAAAVGAESWVAHASGTIRSIDTSVAHAPRSFSLEVAQARCTTVVDVARWYEQARGVGLEYGPGFRGVRQAWRGAAEAVAFVELAPPLAAVAGDYAVHPAFLDACFHVLGIATDGSAEALYLPVAIDAVRFQGASPARGWVHASVSQTSPRVTGSLRVFDEGGALVLEVEELALQRLESRAAHAAAAAADTRFSHADAAVTWESAGHPDPAATPADEAFRLKPEATQKGSPEGHWVVVTGGGEVADLVAIIRAAGADCDVLPAAESADLGRRGVLAGVIVMAPSFDGSAETVCGAALDVVRALNDSTRRPLPRLVLVTRGARVLDDDRPRPVEKRHLAQAALWGLGSVIALEAPALRCVRVDLDPSTDGYDGLLRELAAPDAENEIALRQGSRFVARLTEMAGTARATADYPRTESWTLTTTTPGVLDGLRPTPAVRRAPGAREVEIEVAAAGLNFSDVMKAMGLYPGSAPILGAECAGVVTRVGRDVGEWRPGDQVMAIAPHAFAPFVCTDAALVVRKPGRLDMEAAAAVPVAFLTALYALDRLARIGKGDRVLVHAGTGGVGLAAIQIARRAGAEIYATAGTAEKRSLLLSLGVAGAFDSRSLDFAPAIRALTGGHGVDVVLNSLAGDALTRSLDLLAPHGRFLEIGKSDIYQGRRLDLAPFQKAISFHAIDLDRMFRERRDEIQALLAEIGAALEGGALTPLPLRVFPMAEAVQAFRHMAQARHVGKVVLSAPRRGATTPGLAVVRGDASYLVTGGTGALGLQVARWLADRGARHIVLASRRAPSDGAAASIQALRDMGVDAVVQQADVAVRADVERLVAMPGMPPLRGVVHAAGVLADAALAAMTPERLHTVLAPKVDGAWHLHALTADLPLDWFVLFSSLASVTGSPGQGNYAAANAALDALAQYRRSMGLPALSINWGPWADAGMAATDAIAARLAREGLRPLPAAEALARMDALLGGLAPAQVVVSSADWARIGRVRSAASSPLLGRFRAATGGGSPADGATPAAPGLSRDLLARTAADARTTLLEAHIREQISRVSGIPVARLDVEQSLAMLGIDSLTSLELFTHLEETLQTPLPPSLMTAELTIARLAQHLADGVEVAWQ